MHVKQSARVINALNAYGGRKDIQENCCKQLKHAKQKIAKSPVQGAKWNSILMFLDKCAENYARTTQKQLACSMRGLTCRDNNFENITHEFNVHFILNVRIYFWLNSTYVVVVSAEFFKINPLHIQLLKTFHKQSPSIRKDRKCSVNNTHIHFNLLHNNTIKTFSNILRNRVFWLWLCIIWNHRRRMTSSNFQNFTKFSLRIIHHVHVILKMKMQSSSYIFYI